MEYIFCSELFDCAGKPFISGVYGMRCQMHLAIDASMICRPSPDFIRDLDSRLAALDGRVPKDLYGNFDNTVYPLVSEVGLIL